MTATSDKVADDAMRLIWREWFEFYQRHFRGKNIDISAADQMAFYEIAQPIIRELALTPGRRKDTMTFHGFVLGLLVGIGGFYAFAYIGECIYRGACP